jgi:hypothetical protein
VLEGDLEVDVEDYATGSRVVHHVIADGRRVRLEFEGEPPALTTGARVRVRGRLRDADTLALARDAGAVTTLVSVAPNTFGEQRTIVILVNFQNNPSQPYAWTTAQQVTFQTTSDFFRENSYGQTWLSGTVVGWFTIAMDAPAGSCDYSRIASLADQAATASGVSLGGYERKIYAFPQSSGCGWWGLGSVGGNPSRAWVNGSYTLKVVAHELGHNFGDYHSKSRECSTSGCTESEYGDSHDVMGNPSAGHMNAFQKERLGWLDYGGSPDILDVTAGGSYWIDGFITPGSAPKALRILKSVDSAGKRTWYYAETRTRTGFDGGIAPGVLLHSGSESTGNSSMQIDLSPETTSFDRVLDAGQTFTDTAIGLSITTTSAGDAGAWIQIGYGGVPCVASAPSLTLLPAASQTITIGQSADFTVRLKNNDGAGCAMTSFALAAAAPAGWSSTFGQTPVQLSPGASVDVAMTLVPPSGASGTHAFTANAARQSSEGPGAAAAGAVDIVTALTTSLQIAKSGPGFKFSATVRAGTAPVAGAQVTFVVTTPNGTTATMSATTNSSGVATVTYKPHRKDPRGVHQVAATAVFGSLSGSASGSFSN